MKHSISLPSAGDATSIFSMLEALGAEYVRVNRARSKNFKRRLRVATITIEMEEVAPTDTQITLIRRANAATAFMDQATFASPQDVGVFFDLNAATARGVVGLSQEDLDKMAAAILATRTHCDF